MPEVTRVRRADESPPGHHLPGAEHHRNVQGGAVRAGVFGMSDGLLTTVALVLGIAGAHPAAAFVRLAGLLGIVGGALSMAAGEYVSMSAQTELIERELDIERRALRASPDVETRELAAIYRGRGLTADEATYMATRIMADPEVALEVHAREELGVSPGQIGSPRAAAGASLVTFTIGGFIPVIPWFVLSGTTATLVSLGVSAVAAFTLGWVLALFTGRRRWHSALRQLLIAAGAAGATYALGAIVGTHFLS